MLRGIMRSLMIFAFGVMITAAAQASTFRQDDRWCAAGDSITHGGTYHNFVMLYYATRFPDRHVSLFNCGINGDTAGGLLKRLDWDVLSKKPTVVSVMLGMNDVGIGNYGPDRNTPEQEQLRQRSLDAYKRNMKELAERLKSAGVRMIFITPSIYDQTAALAVPAFVGGNDGLGVCAQYVRDLAREYNGELVDFYLPMKRINEKQQEIDPKFTLTGPDRVHPGDLGHFVMAYLFLKSQGAPQYVSYMGIDAAKEVPDMEQNCAVSGLKVKDDSVSFTCLENSLPFPVRDDLKQALSIVPFTATFNQEILRIRGLADGRYALKIDKQLIGTYSASELGNGVNLATLADTPQYKQAVMVMYANDKRHTIVTNNLRNIAAVEYLFWPDRNKGPVTLEEIKPTINKIRDANRNTPTSYLADMIDAYERDKPHEAELNKKSEYYTEEMYRLAQPQPHEYSINRVK